MPIRLATRGSALALAQASLVAEMLGGAELIEATADGAAGDKSRFVRGVERVLLDGDAEIGVHSAKDIPSGMAAELSLAGVPAREDPADAWVGDADSLAEVAEGARVGTASLRRRSQLLALRPDLALVELHGNVDTRLRRLDEGELDAIVLAAAGLNRLGRSDRIGFLIPPGEMTPAAGQGALALQVRAGDAQSRASAAAISDPAALIELTAERAVVAELDASCATPIGVRARLEGGALAIDAYVGLPDGSEWIRDSLEGGREDPAGLGVQLSERLIGAGARELLDAAERMTA